MDSIDQTTGLREIQDECERLKDVPHWHCGCAEVESPHSCPYAVDVNGNDEINCTCCDTCTARCADDV